MQHYFIDQELNLGMELILPAELYQHAIVVLRKQVGDQFELVDIHQTVSIVTVTQIEKKTAQVKVVEQLDQNAELPVAITIACGLPKNDKKTELIVEKGTEMGATSFIFFPSQYAIGKWKKQKVTKKLERLQKKATSAAEQSHRNVVPTVEYRENLAAVADGNYDCCLVAYEEAGKTGEKSVLAQELTNLVTSNSAARLIAVFGPEGGIAPAEIDLLKAHGFAICGLGPRILRAETAPLYFLGACSYQLELASVD